MTTEEFITKAKVVHGDKYDYSKVEYVNSHTKVCIICPEHGEFWQTPSSHINNGSGCPKCGNEKVKNAATSKMPTTQEFVEKLKSIYGDKYDFSKVEYKNNKVKVCVVCPKHGEFFKTPSELLCGKGCPRCNKSAKNITTEEFIERAKEVHGDKYDYSKVVYKNSREKVCIICPIHGEFWQTPSKHLRGGCWKCAHEKLIKKQTGNTVWFISKANKIHGDKYDYSKVEYVNRNTKVCIICPVHGEFWQTPSSHLSGAGCPKCKKENHNLTRDEFISKAKEIHGNKYDYSNVEFVNMGTKVRIICPVHGEFWQTPSKHLSGRGCQKCAAPNYAMTSEEFISKIRNIYGDKYDYSKVVYNGTKSKICLICHEKDKFGREHGEFWRPAEELLKGLGCQKCSGKHRMTTEEFIESAKLVHGDKYDYSKTVFTGSDNKVCIICPEHGEFWQTAYHHLKGVGCPNCQGLRKEYKYNLLQEFASEYDFRAFLENNDVNILQVILRNVEPKYEPIRDDVIRAISHTEEEDPIAALGAKYQSNDENEEDTTTVEVQPSTNITTVDLDDDDAVVNAIGVEDTTETTRPEPTIEDVVKNTEHELEVITKIEHMLTPEDRKYIMDKFLNDKRRDWMAMRETNKVG